MRPTCRNLGTKKVSISAMKRKLNRLMVGKRSKVWIAQWIGIVWIAIWKQTKKKLFKPYWYNLYTNKKSNLNHFATVKFGLDLYPNWILFINDRVVKEAPIHELFTCKTPKILSLEPLKTNDNFSSSNIHWISSSLCF